MSDLGRQPQIGRLVGATVLISSADGVRLAALPLLTATLTRDPGLVAGVTAAQYAPWLLLGLVAGVLVDRVADQARLMSACAVGRALGYAALGLLAATNVGGVLGVYALAFALGVGEALYECAAQAIVPALVQPGGLETANGRLWAARCAGRELAGPVMGGLLFGAIAALPFAMSAALTASAAPLVHRLRPRARARSGSSPPSIGMDLAAGFRFLWRHDVLRLLTVASMVQNLVVSAWESVFVLYALEVLGVDGRVYALLITVGAAGGVAGSLAAARLAVRFGMRHTLAATVALAAGAHVALGLIRQPVITAALLVVVSGMWGVWNALGASARQRLAPAHLLGRVNSVARTVAIAGIPVGAVLGGCAARWFGVPSPFLIAAPVLAGIAISVWTSSGSWPRLDVAHPDTAETRPPD